ncbi:hypothetical protein [Enterococcus casseliflavus]|uniref:hypothetical protein n=1 Tax=Enterococcus casseliflavus TaxID=37734 RepID=UPI002542F40A|nr:hypothetical protein [Enterococcus casseliflavus]MDK4448985.1 hypothetical protein [Enterococcus casseliflavus]
MQTVLAFYISLGFIYLTIKIWDVHGRILGLTWVHEWLHYMMSLITNPDLSTLIGKDRLRINRKASKGADNEDLVGSVENIRGNAISVTLTALAPFLAFVFVGIILMSGVDINPDFSILSNVFSLIFSLRFLIANIVLLPLFIFIFSRLSVLSNTDFALISNPSTLAVTTVVLVISQFFDVLEHEALADYKIYIVLILLLIYFVLLQTILAPLGHLSMFLAIISLHNMIYIFMTYLLLFSGLFLIFSYIYNTFRAKKEGDLAPEGETIKDDNQNFDDKDIEI